MSVIFIYENEKKDWGTTILRGFDISKELNVEMIEISEALSLTDKKLICLKLSDYSVLIDISNKNEIIIDMVDFKSENQLHLFKFFSFGIFTSNEQRKKYMRFFKYPEKCQIIYHHWDKRFKDLKIQEKNEVKICYFGEKKKCELFGKIKDIEFHHIDGLTFKNSINLYLFYNCHYIIKPDIHEDLIQPMTKLSNAASLNCPVIVSKRPQYIELLGEDYPYYVEKNNLECIEQCINKIKSTFNKEEWNKALYQMEKVKIKTSFESIINDYRNKILK